ncbi:MAG: glycogen/starch synthase [Bacteroidota bacterium]
MRVLYVAGEVAPFSETTETASLLRALPDALQEEKGIEPRIMMPRYGVVSERRNRLHEVIRLSGTKVPVGDDTDTLQVKVASIPGIRLQVYFMDSVAYYKRKGLYKDRKTEEIFSDNPARALYFSRAALLTAKKLGWGPDLVHASGWIAAFTPHVLATEFADDDLFSATRSVYTPDVVEGYEATLSAEEAEALGLPSDWAGKSLRQIGLETADRVAYASGDSGSVDGPELTGEPVDMAEAAFDLYSSLAPTAKAA